MSEKQGIKLPVTLLREIGISDTLAPRSNTHRKPSRKVSRKLARIEKRKKPVSRINKKPLVRVLQKKHQAPPERDEDPSDQSIGEDHTPVTKLESWPTDSSRISETRITPAQRFRSTLHDEPDRPRIPRQVRVKLAEDDAEIAALERRLGLKRKKRMSGSAEDAGLRDLLAELGEVSDDGDDEERHEKKAFSLSKDEEDWLRSKRRQATSKADKALPGHATSMSESDLDTQDSSDDFDDLGCDSASSDFDGFEEEDEQKIPSTKRENPYIAPQATGELKYIPPSLRRRESGDTDNLYQLQRQLQGILNRLSEAKVLSIASDIEKMYQENARQHVTTVLLDILFPLICDPSPLQDTFMILHGGLVAALYKTLGAEFGAQVIQRVVDNYDQISQMDSNMKGKRLSNLMTFLAELYNFHVIGSPLIYDLIRNLTADLSEDNAELLLRIVRISGFELRQDDSTSLRDLVTLLHASAKAIGADNLSIRTKFMIETIENLKNNKVKTGIAASTIRIEHTTAMKKTLGSINKSAIKATEPLRIGLDDIRNADRKGKWWLVGASFKDNTREMDTFPQKQQKTSLPTEAPIDSKEVDFDQLAREQGMNTEVRRAIFISLVSAYDDDEACKRLTKLGMKSKQRLEIPKVLVHCVGAEKTYYNRFYTRIARHLCQDRNLRKAFSFALWDIIKRVEDDDASEEDDEIVNQLDVTAMVYMGKMYGELVVDGMQSILLLKHMDLAHPAPKSKTFAEVFLITIFQSSESQSKKGTDQVKRIFTVTEQAPDMVAGLQLFLRKIVRRTSLVQDSKDREKVTSGCKIAERVLLELMSNGIGRQELSNLL